MTARVTVVGVGSPQGADRFGWQVIEYLTNEVRLESLAPGQISLASSDRPGATLLELIKEAQLAIIVDAVEGGEKGRVVRLNKEQLLVNHKNLSSHAFGVAEALALGQALNILPSDIILYGLETGEQARAFTTTRQSIVTIGESIGREIQQRLDGSETQHDKPAVAVQ